VPLPIAFKENVLVMEFIGDDGIAAKTLKETPMEALGISIQELYEKIVEYIARLAFKAKIVHADLS
jgi:RIO kinase 1